MLDIIQLLPDSIANQIAAGEVVQRPASVVKELLENAIDAGADKIQLIVKDAGTTYIQVIDNGSGMSETDARMCWERHATSKIKQANDLFKINTFGFRGEALASIAAVAQVDMKTRRKDDNLGIHIRIEASEVLLQEPVQCSEGTSITVKNLFYNIPARKNFLKSASIETKHIFDEFNRVAIPNPDIEFTFTINQNEAVKLPQTTLENRITDVLGKRDKGLLIALHEKTDIINIAGFIGSPEYAKRIRGDQFLFINGRFIKEPYFNHAIQNAFEGLIPEDHFPFYVVFFEIDPSRIDVNVHPTKTEVKFEDSKPIYSILRSVVKKALGGYTLSPQIGDNQIFTFTQSAEISHDLIKRFNAPTPTGKFNPFESDIKPNTRQDWGKVLDPFKTPEIPQNNYFSQGRTEPENTPVEQLFSHTEKDTFDGMFQLGSDYIICSKNRELYIVNLQYAHEKVYYEQFKQQFQNHKFAVQTLLFPRMTSFNPADHALVHALIDEIRQLGFDMSPFGDNSFIINGVPSLNDKADPQVVLEGLIENYKQNEQDLHLEKKENLARSMARNVALKASTHLSQSDMEQLMNQLFQCQQPGFLPNGQAVFIKISPNGLKELFSK
jgi:DNA mismatch repair protein MutL